MRVRVQQEGVPPGMAGAWHIDAHETNVPAFLDAAQLVAAVFGLRLTALRPGETLRTVAGRFQVESVRDDDGCSEVVLLTDAPGLHARLGITASASAEDGCCVLLHTSVHPLSWIGRAYFRMIQPFHHLLVEWLLLGRLRKHAGRTTT
jgi:hypothetical protein